MGDKAGQNAGTWPSWRPRTRPEAEQQAPERDSTPSGCRALGEGEGKVMSEAVLLKWVGHRPSMVKVDVSLSTCARSGLSPF